METQIQTQNQTGTAPKLVSEQRTTPLAANTQDFTFNFKRQKIEDFEQSDLNNVELMSQYEKVADSKGKQYLKRLSVTVPLDVPEFISLLPEDAQSTVQDLVVRAISDYVKLTYVDQFEPVGDHSWSTIQTWMNTRGSRTAKWDFSDETFANAVEHLKAYLSQLLGHPVAAHRISMIAKKRFSRASIQQYIGKFDTDIIEKLQARLNSWAEYTATQDEDNADDFAPVYEAWNAALEKHKKADTSDIDITEIL